MSPRYYGYYLQGFREAFGWRVRLSTRGFPTLSDPKAGMAAILPDGQRIFIAANDWAYVDPEVVAWADVVGQVNVDLNAERSPKVLPLGPSFGTPWSSAPALAGFVARTGAMTFPRRIPAMLRDYLRACRACGPTAGRATFSGLYDLECLLVTGGGRYGGCGRRLRVSPLSG